MLLDANVILNINLHLGMQIIWQYLEDVWLVRVVYYFFFQM